MSTKWPGHDGTPSPSCAAAGAVAVVATLLALAGGCGGSARGADPAALREAREADAEFGVPWETDGDDGARRKQATGDTEDARAKDDEGKRHTGEPVRVLEGRASYYSDALAGNTTASGDVYDPRKLTAASRELPFGTVVRVVRTDNGRSVTVRINDRGPFGSERRILDLSRAAAERLDMIRAGVVDIRAEVLELGGD